MKNNNKGFTFVELLVGIVIFAVIATAALGFLVAASRTYGSVNGAMTQQLDGDMAVNLISEYLIDCNDEVGFSDNALIIRNTSDSFSFRFDAAAKALYFGASAAPSDATDLLLEHVTQFVVELPPRGKTADYAKLSITTEKRGKTLVFERTVALRNKPELINNAG